MGITFKHDAAGVAMPANSASRKYGQQLVLQQQQQKYAAQQAGYDRLFQLGRDAQQNQNQFVRDVRQQTFMDRRDRAQNDFALGRDKARFEQQQQMQQAEQQRKFMEDARKQSSGIIMEGIKNGEYDPATARKLQQNLVEESEALGNPGLDATQRAEALAKLRAERALLSSNRIQKPPTPTPQEQFEQSVITDPQTGMRYIPNAKGGLEPLPESKQQQKMRPKSFQDYYGENEDKFQKDLDATVKSLEKTDPETGAVTTPTQDEALAQMQKDYDFRQKALGRPQYGTPTDAPAMPGAAAPAPGASQSILEQPSISPDSKLAEQARALGMDVTRTAVPAQSPAPPSLMAQRPDAGVPPSPSSAREPLPLTDNASSINTAGATPPVVPQQVKVGGKPLAVTPGTLTPQETAARSQIMELPREDRIKALMPYDPQMKGRTLEQVLEDPETKAQYDALSKQGLTTGNYREDILGHLDEMLQNNVLNGPGTPPDAYVGMRADEVTDPKAKAEVAKMPRPKSMDDRNAIRSGQMYVDPEGVIRART